MNASQLLPLGLNVQFTKELISTSVPCFAMGLVRKNARTWGILALPWARNSRIATASGFRFGHQLMGQSTELKPRACMTAKDEVWCERGFWVWSGP